MNVLELCLSPGLGGLELYAFRAAQALNKQHKVVAVINPNGKLRDYFEKHASISPDYLNYSRSYLPLMNARRLARLIDHHQIDVVHMHWGNDLAVAALAKKISRRKPALVYTRQMKITRSKDDLYHRFLYDEMDLMLTITKQLEADAQAFISRYAEHITTLYYGVDAPDEFIDDAARSERRAELGFNHDDFIIGLIGRLEHNKGQHLLIEALALASRDNIQLKAMIAGHEMTPGYRDTLRQLADSLGVTDNTVFMDFVSEPQQMMQLCDTILLASDEETFGLVLPEAMRAGVAVIGSNRGGVPEIIDHENTGLLFESFDIDSLYAAIKRLYLEPEFKHQLATQGKHKADEVFNTEQHFSMLEQHLKDITSSAKN